MLYYINEIQFDKEMNRTAGIKARDDIADILRAREAAEIKVEIDATPRKKGNALRHISAHFSVAALWEKSFSDLRRNDILLIQLPVVNHSVFFANGLKKVKRRGVKIILLLHDIEMLRVYFKKNKKLRTKLRIRMEETSILRISDAIIVHNDKMKDALSKLGFDRRKMHSIEIFDYLISEDKTGQEYRKIRKDGNVIIAGNLRRHKAGYAYYLPDCCGFNLYGVGYENGSKADNINYFGSFDSEKLPSVLEGSFGLVWDGERTDTCSGAYGEYLRLNNPHKASLYLASGIPVAIWEKAALADFVKAHNCGIVLSSLEELKDKRDGLSEEQYTRMRKNAELIGSRLKDGYFTKKVLDEILTGTRVETGIVQ